MIVSNIPYRHTIGRVPQGVMIRDRGNPADNTACLHGGHPLQHLVGLQAELLCQRRIGFGDQRQARLRGNDDPPVGCIQPLAGLLYCAYSL